MKEIKGSWLLLSGFIGVILGTLFANGMERFMPEALTVFAIDQYSVSNAFMQQRGALGWHLLRQRSGQMLGVFVIGCLCNSVLLLFLLTGFCGFVWGLMLSLETMRLGIQGLFLAIACFLPQGIFYILAICLFLIGKEEIRYQNGLGGKVLLKGILLPLVLAGIGILSEIWASPPLICWILQ